MPVFERCDFSPEWNQLCPEWYVDPKAPAPVRRWSFFAAKHEADCKEIVVVKAKFFEHDSIVTGEKAAVEIFSDFHPVKKTEIELTADGAEIPVTLDRPGFVRISITARRTTGFYGIGFAICKIQPYAEVEGFDAYWEKQLARLAAVPADVLEESPLSFPDHPGTISFNVRVRSINDTPVSAILSMPEKAAPKSLPGYVFFHGAGIRPSFPPLPWAKHGFLALNVSAMAIRYGQDRDYEAQKQAEFKEYPAIRSADPEKIPFNDMALRVVRALQYLKSRPEWDGKTLIVHGGSQGGWQSFVAAALDKDVTYIQAEAPANCNVGGALEGRIPSWPFTIVPGEGDSPENRSARMFDGLAFARRAMAPAVITVGYSDCAAVPSSVCAVNNVYGGPHDLWTFPDLGHEQAVFWSGEKQILEAAGINK